MYIILGTRDSELICVCLETVLLNVRAWELNVMQIRGEIGRVAFICWVGWNVLRMRSLGIKTFISALGQFQSINRSANRNWYKIRVFHRVFETYFPWHLISISKYKKYKNVPLNDDKTLEWPAPSPDLAQHDFLCGGKIKNAVYKNKPENIDGFQLDIFKTVKLKKHAVFSVFHKRFLLRMSSRMVDQ